MEEKPAQTSLDKQKKADHVTDLKRNIDERHRKADRALTRPEGICAPEREARAYSRSA